jgi:hypothetical protein
MKINLCPDVSLLNSLVERSGATLRGMLAELLDNAFDQNATRIDVTTDKDSITIEDNGLGVVDWTTMLKLGGSYKSESRAVGRWGVGFKHAAIWLARTADIRNTASERARLYPRDLAGSGRLGGRSRRVYPRSRTVFYAHPAVRH